MKLLILLGLAAFAGFMAALFKRRSASERYTIPGLTMDHVDAVLSEHGVGRDSIYEARSTCLECNWVATAKSLEELEPLMRKHSAEAHGLSIDAQTEISVQSIDFDWDRPPGS